MYSQSRTLEFLGGFAAAAAIAVLCFTLPAVAVAQSSDAATAPKAQATIPPDYSSLECLRRSAAHLGKDIPFIELLTSKHLGSSDIVSAESLSAVAQEHGLSAQRASGLTVAQLERAGLPAILHVKANRYATAADRHIVLLSARDGQATIFVPPADERTVHLESLATRWSGEAVFISDKPINVTLATSKYAAYFVPASLAVLALASIGTVRVASGRWRLSPPGSRSQNLIASCYQCAAIAMIAGAVSVGGRLAMGSGLVVQSSVPVSADGPDPLDFTLYASGQEAATSAKLDVLDLKAARTRHDDGDLFLDAREPGEFAAGHIAGSLNCPTSDSSRVRLHLAGISQDRPLIVYCASARCGKARYLGNLLIQLGFKNVALYDDGWAKWSGRKSN